MASFLLFTCQKGWKIMLCTQHRYIQCYVERVERLCYVHNIDTFSAMSKGSKDYVMLKKETYTSLLISFSIFNQFSIPKSFGMLRLRPFQPYYQMVCMSKHVEGVKSYFDLWPLQHALTYIPFDSMVNSKSFVSKDFLQIKWKFKLINALQFKFWPKLWIRNFLRLKLQKLYDGFRALAAVSPGCLVTVIKSHRTWIPTLCFHPPA